MSFEYAVEPQSLDTWSTLRYFLDMFGVGQGRFISKYPSDWETRVLGVYTDAKPVEKTRIVEALVRMKKALLKTKRAFQAEKPWVENALAAHELEPFRAIIVKASSDHPCTLVADDLTGETTLWQVEVGGAINRTASKLATLATSLLALSSEIVFVDQHYSSTAKHGRPLTELLRASRSGKPLSRIEYHMNSMEAPAIFERGLVEQVPYLGLLPDEVLIFVRWSRIDEGENLHPRYILTIRGGIRVDYGLDEGDGTTDWSRLSEALWRQRWDQFKPDSKVFTFVDAWKASLVPVTPTTANGWKSTEPSVVQVRWNGSKWIGF